MNEVHPPDSPGGVAGALGTLRHALSDPLSAAGVRLELLERRLVSVAPDEASLADRVRAAKADLAVAGRLLDLLLRLAAIAGEEPVETSLAEICGAARVLLDERSTAPPRLLLRRLASAEAVHSMAWFLGLAGPAGTLPVVTADSAGGRVTLRIEARGERRVANLGRLFDLPRGEEGAEELFLARAGVEADGGWLRLDEVEGRLVAALSWPKPAEVRDVRAAA
jgi:hypothetical protein